MDMRLVWLFLAACSYAPQPGEVPPDTMATPDAFNPASQCPPDYTLTLTGQTSRYRILLGSGKAWEHSDDCNDDLPGRTHLVAIDDAAELAEVEAAVENEGSIDDNKAWVGGVQLRDQVGAGIGWLLVTGGPLITSAWSPGEPNDGGGGNLEDNEENFVGVERGRDGLIDFPTDEDQGAVCECDGKPVDQTAAATIDLNRDD